LPKLRTRDEVELFYEEHGNGPPVVLCYGIGGNTDQWDTNTAALSRDHRLILWEPRGNARSESPADPGRYSFQRWVLDLRDLLDGLGVSEACVGGHSLGGGIATRFALSFPDRVHSLIVTNSSSATGAPMSIEMFMMWARSVEAAQGGIDALAQYQFQHNPNIQAFLQLNPQGEPDLLERFRRNDAFGFLNSIRAMMGMEPFASELDQLAIPILLLTGDRDPARMALQQMHDRVESSLVVIASSSHFGNREQPVAWNEAVVDFLSRHR
jgi:pimeloyl-ACP methyl ester carboxylesterase